MFSLGLCNSVDYARMLKRIFIGCEFLRGLPAPGNLLLYHFLRDLLRALPNQLCCRCVHCEIILQSWLLPSFIYATTEVTGSCINFPYLLRSRSSAVLAVLASQPSWLEPKLEIVPRAITQLPQHLHSR